jgi:membrane protein
MMAWLDGFQRRHPAVGFLVAVIYKYVDDQGGYLAALITYYAFVSLFPALLLLTTVLGVVLVGHPELQQQVVHSAVAQFPVIGDQLGRPQGLSGGPIGVTIGIVVAVYGGLGVGQAVQNGMDTLWAVPCGRGCAACCCCCCWAAGWSRPRRCPRWRMPRSRSGCSARWPRSSRRWH